MARTEYSKLLGQAKIDIEDKFLVIDTKQDGYFGIFKGVHPYRVVKEGLEDYAVYPVYWTEENTLTNEPYPIIRTVDGDVFFVKRTTNDPYNGPDLDKVQREAKTVEHKVVNAFNVFAQSEFTLGNPNPIHIFIGDEAEVGVEDEAVTFEFRDLKGNVVEPESGGDTGEGGGA